MMTNKLLKRLRIEFIAFWAICLCFIALNEFNILPNGFYAGNGSMEYYLNTLSIFMTLVFVPGALILFSKMLPKKVIPIQDETIRLNKYLLWSEVRLSLLFVATIIDLSIYYITVNNTGGLCALIAVTASLFIWPNESKIQKDLGIKEE